MKQMLAWFGPLLGMTGSVGLLLRREALVGWMAVLSQSVDDSPHALASSFADLRWVILSSIALAVGATSTVIGISLRDRHQRLTSPRKSFSCTAGLLWAIATVPLIWTLFKALETLQLIASGGKTPTAESISELIGSAQPAMTFSSVLLIIASAIALLASINRLPSAICPDIRCRGLVAQRSAFEDLVAEAVFMDIQQSPNNAEAEHFGGIRSV